MEQTGLPLPGPLTQVQGDYGLGSARCPPRGRDYLNFITQGGKCGSDDLGHVLHAGQASLQQTFECPVS